MGYKRRPPTPPNADEVEAVAYVRSRANEIGIQLLMTDSQLRKVLYKFIGSRLKCGVYYQNVSEAARSYWDQDKPFFEVLSWIIRVAHDRMLGEAFHTFKTDAIEIIETGVWDTPEYSWEIRRIRQCRLIDDPQVIIYSFVDHVERGTSREELDSRL